jgi:hypothetical protein
MIEDGGRRRGRWPLAIVIACTCLLALAATAQANTILVSTTADPPGPGSCPGAPCSLRQAVASAESGDMIVLAAGAEYELTQGSPIAVDKSLTIEGDESAPAAVSGFGNFGAGHRLSRIMTANDGAALAIEAVDFVGGVDENDEIESGNPLNQNGGGALFIEQGASVELEEDEFVEDGFETSGQPVGGAISSAGTLDVSEVTFAEDGAVFGGALFSRGGTINAKEVTFEDDGVFDDPVDGGAVFLEGGTAADFENTTVVDSGQASSFGGGIVNAGATLTLTNDTLAGNVRGSLETDVGASTTVQNTILASGVSDGSDFDCVAAGEETDAGLKTAQAITEDSGNNLDQDNVCGLEAVGDELGADPRLAPIFFNGGLVTTEALLHESPAIDAGNPAGCPPVDAREVPRPQHGICDIGAFEAEIFGQPAAETSEALADGPTAAILRATVGFDGEAGAFHFLWGTSATELNHQTPEIPAGVIKGEAIESQVLGELSPATTYFYEAVAENASGSVTASKVASLVTEPESPGGGGAGIPGGLGPTIPTSTPGIVAKVPATLATLPPPVLGHSIDVEVVSGQVLIALPTTGAASAASARRDAGVSLSKGLHFIPLTEARQIPVGSTLETTAGVARIQTATATAGKLQVGDFGAGIFKLLQQRKQRGLTELNIVNNLSPKKVCATLGKGAAVAAKLSSKVLGRIHGSAHGRFVTKGQYSAATVRGTIWSVSNQCNGTLTKVTRDVVTVRDFRRHKTITLHSGQSYLAHAPGA